MSLSYLKKIQDTVVQYGKILSQMVNMDIVIVDSDCLRIAGTGFFEPEIDVYVGETAFVFNQVMRTKRQIVVENPGEHPLCTDCPRCHRCNETYEISAPILMDDMVIGVIGMVCMTQEQKELIQPRLTIYLEFLRQIAGLVASAAKEHLESERNRALNGMLHEMVNRVSQGILVLDEHNRITSANEEAERLLKLEKSEELEKFVKVEIQETGDEMNHQKEYKLLVNGSIYTVFGTCYQAQVGQAPYGTMLIFHDIKVLQDEIYEITQLSSIKAPEQLIGDSQSTRQLKEYIEKIADAGTTVLITGESGTGKEVAATSIWRRGKRNKERFITIHCGAIPDSTMEYELFGYVKGAFSGADPNGRMGKFELANGGIIFLDEIGDLPIHLQGKLLRAIQEHVITRVGSNHEIQVNVRIIAATNRDLNEMIRLKKFRRDLYYRLNVIPIVMTPLRERTEEIPQFVRHFSARYCRLFGKKLTRIAPEVMECLKEYDWPGNVRELENCVEFMVSMMGEDGVIDLSMVGSELKDKMALPGREVGITPIKELERREIIRALDYYGYHTEGKKLASARLGMGIATLYRKLEEYGIAGIKN